MQYFPLFFDLNHKPVTVIGGGDVACRKIEPLLKSGASVTLIAPEAHPDLRQLAKQKQIIWIPSTYEKSLIDNAVQIWATTNQPSVNRQVYNDAKSLGIMVNVVDDKPYCDFITPSMIERGPIQLAISSGGASPVLIRNVRRNLEAVLPQNLALLAQFAQDNREWVKSNYATVESRRHFWEAFFDMTEVNNACSVKQLDAALQTCHSNMQPRRSKVIVVEWGEDIELLSLKAARLMQLADVVYSQPDIPREYIEMSRRDADKKSFSTLQEYQFLLNKLETSDDSEGLTHVVFVDKRNRDSYQPKATLVEYVYYATY
ncbi:bifunctional precorrin-2 dehydrogenase/sirohydrochlorin ferrochelatase [Vibrio sp. qd031]|uniref:precorrin-2 dehydrogenase/sirohydrochlorin ferrochelatase family protein n=1 Tax=Vibrio sp. qd031 TaxID=1603038 RepID=UPI000A10C7D6|nr:bifunctional precorrin-2 dehydrogenase/sirohydrochlorin ferrochelatase [Vibrio sp. qd031]